ncbi:MAG: helix-turn-helix transcriptional regulator [Ruminococcaceae bacterium]|nr:helix-turn-helix transcriptional regulator [Oscillospiraceae bacterium]
MFEIDKQKFGAFVAALRREKGYTQKELARQLYISDKAVSKWETGASIPDTVLLIPLSELLEVTVTELLLCRRLAESGAMDAGEMESVVKTAITYSGEKQARTYRENKWWRLAYCIALLVESAEVFLLCRYGHQLDQWFAIPALAALFGAYFCLFSRTTLPSYYDENRITAYHDAVLRLNVPGLSFNNSNWPHIHAVCCVWAIAVMVVFPAALFGLRTCLPDWKELEMVSALITLCGLVVPLYAVGKKYE